MTGEAEIVAAEQDLLEACDRALCEKISERAYRKAEERGFAPGHELDDWLEAEAEVRAEEALTHLEPGE
jgi:hypothetical protein